MDEENTRLSQLQEKLALRNDVCARDAARIAELEEKLERRNATINEMRRDFALELLQLRLSGASETSKLEAANRAMERLKRDDDKIRSLEEDKGQLLQELTQKNQEIVALSKVAQMEENRFKKTRRDMQKSIYDLEDQLKASHAELKHVKGLLSNRAATIEQLNYSISQRDDNYLKLEQKLVGAMVRAGYIYMQAYAMCYCSLRRPYPFPLSSCHVSDPSYPHSSPLDASLR